MPYERRVGNIVEVLGERQLLLLLLVNLIVVILYLLLNLLLKICWRKKNVKGIWLKAAVMLLCPAVGACFFAMGYLCNKIIFHAAVDLEDVIFSKERIKPQMAAEEESESNIVPIEEAVAITDKDSLRGMIMNVVRGNRKSSLSALSLALGSDDPETSHYAAAALQAVLSEFQISVQKKYDQIMQQKEHETEEEKRARLELLEETIDLLAEFLEQRLLTESEQKKYVGIMEELCDLLLKENADRMTPKRFEAVSMQFLEAEEYEKCGKWCLEAYSRYPEELIPYRCLLKLCFAAGEREQFFRFLDELRASDITIDRATLEMIRVFL